jgi:hypothetical protein
MQLTVTGQQLEIPEPPRQRERKYLGGVVECHPSSAQAGRGDPAPINAQRNLGTKPVGLAFSRIVSCRDCDTPAIPGEDTCYFQHAK